MNEEEGTLDNIPTIADTIQEAEDGTIVVGENGGFIDLLNSLLVPQFSMCRRCPLVNGNCVAADLNSYCRIEEAMVIEVTHKFRNHPNYEQSDDFTIYGLITNLLNLHRLNRVSGLMNLNRITSSKEEADILNKYLSMVKSTNSEYLKCLKELNSTRNQRVKITQSRGSDDKLQFLRLVKATPQTEGTEV